MQRADSPASARVPRRVVLALVYVLAATIGLLASYDFGSRIGGMFVGVVLALNGAVFCSIVVGAVAERWWPPK
jgi:hypothetical protein